MCMVIIEPARVESRVVFALLEFQTFEKGGAIPVAIFYHFSPLHFEQFSNLREQDGSCFVCKVFSGSIDSHAPSTAVILLP